MATVTLPSRRLGSKPTQSMSHLSHLNKEAARRAKKSDRLDADDLTRRLEAHLAEQKLERERRRRKAEAEKCGYNHISRVAAADISRTATPEGMLRRDDGKKQVHKLSRDALKQYVEGVSIETCRDASLGVRRTQAIDRTRAQRDVVGDRNQIQRKKDLKDVAESDKEKHILEMPKRKIRLDNLPSHQKSGTIRPLSMGDANREHSSHDSIFPTKAKPRNNSSHTITDRQDWAQRDEIKDNPRWSVKECVGPILRASESRWMLKTKKDHGDTESLPMSSDTVSPIDVKQKMGTFLARFRRESRISE